MRATLNAMDTVVFELPDRAVLKLSGGNALRFLQDVSTQDVADLAPGAGALAAFLTDKGRVLADGLVLAGDEVAYLVAEEAARPGLEEGVVRVSGLAGVDVEEQRRHTLLVSGSPDPLIALGVAAPREEHAWVEARAALCIRVTWGADGYELLVPHSAEWLEKLVQAGARVGDAADAESKRIAAGRPKYGADVTEETLLNETPLIERAVSFTKGCYPGQESVARVRNLGHVRKILRAIASDAPVAAGDEVLVSGEPVGAVTSAAGAYAMAIVPADLMPGDRVAVGASAGTITDAGW
jgi:folate-binding protein YgfZ